jgi:hypothetical protein
MPSNPDAWEPLPGDPQPGSEVTPWSAPLAPEPSTAELLEKLGQDRLWLLRQLDSGRWSEWRLDLAALERELGQLIEQAGERL